MPDNNYGMVNMIGGLIMTKKVKFRKIETELPSDAIITQISNIDDNTRYANFEVSVHLKKIQEMDSISMKMERHYLITPCLKEPNAQ